MTLLVSNWLKKIGLSHAEPMFRAAGFVTPASLAELDPALFDALGVTHPEDRRKLFDLIQWVKRNMDRKDGNLEIINNSDDEIVEGEEKWDAYCYEMESDSTNLGLHKASHVTLRNKAEPYRSTDEGQKIQIRHRGYSINNDTRGSREMTSRRDKKRKSFFPTLKRINSCCLFLLTFWIFCQLFVNIKVEYNSQQTLLAVPQHTQEHLQAVVQQKELAINNSNNGGGSHLRNTRNNQNFSLSVDHENSQIAKSVDGSSIAAALPAQSNSFDSKSTIESSTTTTNINLESGTNPTLLAQKPGAPVMFDWSKYWSGRRYNVNFAPKSLFPTNIFVTTKHKQNYRNQKARQIQQCLKLNPGYQLQVYDDDDMHNFMATYFPQFLNFYESLPKNVMKADIWRYLVLYKYGGIYMDTDIECVKPFNEWDQTIQKDSRNNNQHRVDVVLGLEFCGFDEDRGKNSNYIQFTQWTMASQPNQTIFYRAVEMASEMYLDKLASDDKDRNDPLVITGPGIITLAVLEFLVNNNSFGPTIDNNNSNNNNNNFIADYYDKYVETKRNNIVRGNDNNNRNANTDIGTDHNDDVFNYMGCDTDTYVNGLVILNKEAFGHNGNIKIKRGGPSIESDMHSRLYVKHNFAGTWKRERR